MTAGSANQGVTISLTMVPEYLRDIMTAGLANQGVTISLTMLLQYLDCLTCCHNISDHTVIISMDIMTVRSEIL